MIFSTGPGARCVRTGLWFACGAEGWGYWPLQYVYMSTSQRFTPKVKKLTAGNAKYLNIGSGNTSN